MTECQPPHPVQGDWRQHPTLAEVVTIAANEAALYLKAIDPAHHMTTLDDALDIYQQVKRVVYRNVYNVIMNTTAQHQATFLRIT